jgi:deazaflavin-dependent oxidoreductase (nitroreductase family)
VADFDTQYCYVTTSGRVSGLARTIEIWFGLVTHGTVATVYLLAGPGEAAQWVRNLRREPRVALRIGEREFEAQARVVADPVEDALARRLLLEKYQAGYGSDLSDWGVPPCPWPSTSPSRADGPSRTPPLEFCDGAWIVGYPGFAAPG